jgi:mannose-6-phosphate isomerase-like protein (cupin superfamily)
MRLLLMLSAVLAVAALKTSAQAPGVTFLDHEKVAAALAKGGVLTSASNLIVQGASRNAAGQVEVHDKETDVLYIIDGEATFVTGGTMIGGKVTAPGQQRGTDIKGGESRRLVKGDVIVVQAGIPHWFKDVPKSVNYFVVKVLKQ